MPPKANSLLQGTLEMIVLQLLRAEPTNGYDLAQRIETISRDALTINAGSLYPALYRLEERDLIRAHWEESKTGRRVKVYSLTASGRKELEQQREEWVKFSGALAAILKVTG
jgi:PadR family transcriptional regulator, regulatory protein PadR